jgi:hypothetical protein
MKLIARLVKAGKNVICTIHQPRYDIYKLLDHLIVMGEGKAVFSGPTSALLPSLASAGLVPTTFGNPADFAMDVVTTQSSDVLATLAAQPSARLLSERFQNVPDGTVQEDGGLQQFERSNSGFWEQLTLISERTILNVARNPLLLTFTLVLTTVVALIVGSVFYDLQWNFIGMQERLGLFFFSIFFFSFLSLSAIPLFKEERLVFMKERASGYYSPEPYFFAKIMFDFVPQRIVPPLIYACITYSLCGLRIETEAFLLYSGTLVSVNVAAASLTMCISCVVESTGLANALGSFSVLYALLMGGYLVSKQTLDSVPLVNYVQQASWVNWALTCLVTSKCCRYTVTQLCLITFHVLSIR